MGDRLSGVSGEHQQTKPKLCVRTASTHRSRISLSGPVPCPDADEERSNAPPLYHPAHVRRKQESRRPPGFFLVQKNILTHSFFFCVVSSARRVKHPVLFVSLFALFLFPPDSRPDQVRGAAAAALWSLAMC